MKKVKDDKFRIGWFKRLINKIEYYDIKCDYKLIPILIALLSIMIFGILILFGILVGGCNG